MVSVTKIFTFKILCLQHRFPRNTYTDVVTLVTSACCYFTCLPPSRRASSRFLVFREISRYQSRDSPAAESVTVESPITGKHITCPLPPQRDHPLTGNFFPIAFSVLFISFESKVVNLWVGNNPDFTYT